MYWSEPGWAGGEDAAVGGFGDGAVLLPGEVVVEVAEGFLVGDDDDVETGGVGGDLAGVGGGDAAAGGCGERVRGVLLGVLEVGRVDVDLVGGEGADEVLLEGEGGDGAAGKVVLHASVTHGGPVADCGEVEGGGGAVVLDELGEGLGGVEEAGGGDGGEGEAVGGRGDGVALGLGGGGHVGRQGSDAGELDGKWARGGDGAGGEGAGELGGGEGVVWIAGAGGADEAEALGDGLGRGGMELAGDGDEVLCRGGGCEEEGEDCGTEHTCEGT